MSDLEEIKNELKEMIKKIIEKEIRENFSSADFCGCYEGDIEGCFPDGVKRVSEHLAKILVKYFDIKVKR